MTGGQPAYWTRDRRTLEAALALYRAAFERTRIPDERIRQLLEDGRYKLALTATSPTDVRAMALVARFPDERFSHLDYIVTAPADRRRGLASALLAWLLEQARSDGHEVFTLETDDAMLRFYGTRGAYRLSGLPYLFPSPTHGPIPMHIIAWALRNQSELPRERAAAIVRALYHGIHGRAADDPMLKKVVERIEPVVKLVAHNP